jgi:hypothetical protein
VAKELLKRVLLVLLGVSLGVLILEGGLRLYYPGSQRFWRNDSVYGPSLIPNKEGWHYDIGGAIYVKINSKGLRDYEYAYEKRKGKFRILLLGDSFAEAIQVPLEETFPKVLERLLGRNVEVINAGVGSRGSVHELLYFREEGHKYQPDIVMLMFVANDVGDNWLHKVGTSNRATAVPKGVRESIRVKSFLAEHSRLYIFARDIIKRQAPSAILHLLRRMGIARDAAWYQDDMPFWMHVYDREYTSIWEEAWNVTRGLLIYLNKEAGKRDARLVAVGVTMPWQVDRSAWLDFAGSDPGRMDFDKPDRILMGFLRERGIPHLDLRPGFQEFGQKSGGRLHFRYDGHWTREGHRLAADLVAKWLVENGLVGGFSR